ncbi:MAG: DotA/TraY family protein [Gammaproteobacteria bacterium]
MKRVLYTLLSLLLLCPSSAFAFITFDGQSTDKSIEYLGMVFGTVGNVLVPPEGVSQILGQLFNVFNMAVLSMGSIAMVYVIWISAVETAHEGKLMGQKWNAAWIPIRSMIGVGLLLPTASGYSLCQIMMMWVVMQGVHAANAMWTVVLENFEVGAVYDIPPDEGLADVNGASEAAQAMFESMMCLEMLKQKYPDAIDDLGAQPTLYEHDGAIVIGIEGDEHHAEICGGLQPSKEPSDYDPEVWRNSQTVAADNSAGYLSIYAAEAVDGESVSGSDIIMGARKIISGIVASTSKISGPVSLDQTKTDAKADGWLFVGVYYHYLSSWMEEYNPGNLTAPQPIKPDYAELPFTEAELKAKYNAYLEESDLLSPDEAPPTELDLGQSSGLSGALAQLWDSAGLNDLFIDLAMSVIDSISDNDTDPIIALQKLGTDLMISIETMVFTLIGAAVLVALLACIMQSLLPLCWMFAAGIAVLVPVVMVFMTLLWGAGVLLGLYIPLIPFLVFTFAGVSWFLLVVEAMVAAPVAAIGLVNPSAENFGNIHPVMTLTLSLFLRPTLMVVGFIAAHMLLRVLMYMINFGFKAVIESSLTGIGIFGAVAIVVIYCGIAIITVQECFALIYILPDKVIRWIGGQIEKSNVAENVQKAKGYMDKGADAGLQIMKGGVLAAGQVGGAGDGGGGDQGSDGDQGDDKDKDKDKDKDSQGNTDSQDGTISAEREAPPGGGSTSTSAASDVSSTATTSTTVSAGASVGSTSEVASVAVCAI